MKLKVITRLLIGTSLAMVAVAPTLTLSSCASISQWTLPINIGGSEANSPWSDVLTSESNPPHDLIKDFKQNEGYSYYSPRADFKSYLPTNFISYTDRSSGTNNYENAVVYNDKNWNNNTNQSAFYDPKWVDYSDSNLQKMSESYDIGSGSDKKTVTTFTSIQNANLYNALSFNSIALGINLFTSGFLRLMTQDGVMNSKSGKDWYNALFGDIDNSQTSPYLNHGGENTGTDDNKTFYEFLFDLLDSLSQGKFAGKFGQSGINYKFSSSTYGPGPYISGENEANNDTTYNKWFVGWNTDNDNPTQFSFNETSIKENTTDSKVLDASGPSLSSDFIKAKGTSEMEKNIPSARAAYTAFATSGTNKTDLAQNVFYPSSIPVQIPFIITPTDFTYSYYNPLTKHSFQQNDYLLDDINPIKNQVSKTNAWNNFSKHVDTSGEYKDKKTWADSLSFDFKNNPNDVDETNAFYPGANSLFNDLNDKYGSANFIDPTTYGLLSNSDDSYLTTDNLQPNSYICFANYVFASFPSGSDSSNITYESMPIFAGVAQDSSGVPAVFPVSLLYQNAGLSSDLPSKPTNLDLDLWTSKLMPEASALYNYAETDNGKQPWHNDDFLKNKQNNIYTLDLAKLFAKETNIYNFFSTNINANKTPKDYYNDNKDAFQTIWYLLGNWVYSSDDWSILPQVSTKLIQRVDNAK